MDYKDMFNNNAEYQGIVSTFQRKKAKLETMAQQGLYKKEHLQEVAKKLHAELQQNVVAFRQSVENSLQEELKALESKNKRVGYAERPDDVKELEMRFKLASNFDLQNAVQDLDTTDLLEVNLLRSELKNRKMDELDNRVERYAAMNLVGVGGLDADGIKQYEDIQYKLDVFATMGDRTLVAGDEMIPLDFIGQELTKTANMAVNDKSVVRDVDIATF